MNYSYRSRSTALLGSLATPSCTFCKDVAQEIEQRGRENSTFEGAQAKVTAAVTAPGDVRKGLIVNTMLDVTEGRTVRADGSVAQTFPAEPTLPSDMAVIWDGKTWKVLDISVNPKRTS